ncbi:hypothetical protein JCM11491_002836 [Sporobolomyces phaffii]
MNFLSSLSSAVISASSAALSNATSQIPGVSGYSLGDKVPFDASIWTLYSGTKRDDQSSVSIFAFEVGSSVDRRQLLAVARNALRKLRSTRHPNVLKFLDGSESDHAVWIVTEPVVPLAHAHAASTDEDKVFGLLHLSTALTFLNHAADGSGSKSVHGGIRFDTGVWVTRGGEWKLGAFEVCSRLDDPDGAMWSHGGSLPDARYVASPEIRKGGWTSLKEYDPSVYDSWLLHIFIYQLFNGPLPTSFTSASGSETPSLPTSTRGSIPQALFQPWKRLGAQNPRSRLKTSAFLELGTSVSDAGGWWANNRLVRLSTALENFSLSSENEQATLIRTLKAISSSSNPPGPGTANGSTSTPPLPTGFLLYKILPSLLHTFEFSSSSAASLLPLILSLSTPLAAAEYSRLVVPPLLRMYQVPDRAVRMALLEGLDAYADKLTNKEVVDKVWPNLVTGFGDLVPVIREVTVKSVLIIAPKLSDRILNNDLLRYLSKTQTDSEPGIRTNTCILLSRLSPHLAAATRSKVLIPAFARSLRDPFVPARIAGLMALMAGTDGWDKEDLAGKVIPSVGICLVDKEKAVRDQGFKAIDMFVRKCEQLTASMPDTAIPPSTESTPSTPSLANGSGNVPSVGLATNAAGAAGVLAGWAFGGVGKKLSTAELAAPIERRGSTPTIPTASSAAGTPTFPHSGAIPGGFAFEPQTGDAEGAAPAIADWGGDLMDVNDDAEDWDEFESGQPRPVKVDPLAARLTASAASPKPRASSSLGGGKKAGGSMRLGAASKSSALRVPMDMDATDSWDLDLNDASSSPAAATKGLKPKPAPAAALSIAPTPPTNLLRGTTRPSVAVGGGGGGGGAPARPRPPPVVVVPAPRVLDAADGNDALAPPLRSPLPPLSTPPSAPIAPATSTVPPPPTVPPTPTDPSISMVPVPVPFPIPTPSPPPPSLPQVEAVETNAASGDGSSRPASPAVNASSSSSSTPLTKEEKAAKLAAAREERRKRMAAAKAGTK